VTASKGLTTRIRPEGDRSRLHRGRSEAEIEIPANNHPTEIEVINKRLRIAVSHQQRTVENATLDTLTHLSSAPELIQPKLSDAQQGCSFSR
tara:strand:- start:794 stop:1069 length:276 start_codon:yes stop_codon:yes gene_type:complete